MKKTKEDFILSSTLILAILSSFFHTPNIHFIDFKVIISLFNLMILLQGLEQQKFLEIISLKIIQHFHHQRSLSLALTFITFFFSMFITNDVALITFIPITLLIAKKTHTIPIHTIILQTLAANIGSSLTPMGNPQNLFLYSKYHMDPITFFLIMLPFVLLGFVILLFLNLTLSNSSLNFSIQPINIKNQKQTLILIVLFSLVISSIFHLIDYKLTFVIVIISILILDKKLFLYVDYPLLFTFVFFFIFTGNLSHISSIQNTLSEFLHQPLSTFISSIFLSQILSNVPTAILLANFTNHSEELLLGVNIGGLGTLIASLASLISYKFFIQKFPKLKWKFLLLFSLYNFSLLFLFTFIFMLI